jgi:hypothetical protein
MNPAAHQLPAERPARRKWARLAIAGVTIASAFVMARVTADAAGPRYCGGRQATIVGSKKDDSIVGTSGPDVIWSGAGRDRVYGMGGNDLICSQKGDDLVVGGPGNDWIDTGTGNDRAQGEDGWDYCKNGEQVATCEIVPGGSTTPTTSPPTTAPPTTAPPTTAAPTTAPPTTAPPSSRPPGLAVDESRIPAPQGGSNSVLIGPASYAPFASDGVGAMRISCSLSHMNFDDPIVAPGQSRSTHLHQFWGNTTVNASSNSSSIANTGASTCSGGIANRSAYWAPAMIDTRTNAPVTSFHDVSQASNWQHRGAVNGNNGLQVYYKTGYRGVSSASVQNFPAGLRMIAGDARRTTGDGSAWYDAPVTYHCHAVSDHGAGTGHQQSIPSCPAGTLLIMAVRFPQCWDGRNLDSADHKSHMAYGIPGSGCPSSHPVPLPEITMNIRYFVPSGTNTSTWRLSSDTYSGPAGYSGHADWWNGWDRNVFQRVVNNCYRPGLDCQMGLLGDGQALL